MLTYWKTRPKVKSAASCASIKTIANHANPVAAMTGPSRFSGRARQLSRPLPMNDQPTSTARRNLSEYGQP
jgi:hypothetical protein